MIKLYCDGHRVPIWGYLRVTLEQLPFQVLAVLGVPPLTSYKREA